MKTQIETEAKIKLSKKEFYDLNQKTWDIMGMEKTGGKGEEQINTYYEAGDGTIIRIREIKSKHFGPEFILNKKKKRKVETKYKSVEEKELNVWGYSDVRSSHHLPQQGMKNLMSFLGFKKILKYKKYRLNYKFGQDTIISFDHLKIPKNHQYYVEIEGHEENIEKVIRKLKIKSKSIEKRSYLEILTEGKYEENK